MLHHTPLATAEKGREQLQNFCSCAAQTQGGLATTTAAACPRLVLVRQSITPPVCHFTTETATSGRATPCQPATARRFPLTRGA